MIKYKILFFKLLVIFLSSSYAQTKSFREIILKSDIIAEIAHKESHPNFINKRWAISDSESYKYLDSIQVIQYLIGKNSNLEKERIIIHETIDNAFYEDLITTSPILIVDESEGEDGYIGRSTLIFCKKGKLTFELVFSIDVYKEELNYLSTFIDFVKETEKIKSLKKRSKRYIDKYIEVIKDKNNIAGSGPHYPEGELYFFEDILSPDSSFMTYYTSRGVRLNVTKNQKEILKNYAFETNLILKKDHLLALLYNDFPEEIRTVTLHKCSSLLENKKDFYFNDSYIVNTLRFLLSKEESKNQKMVDELNHVSYAPEMTDEEKIEIIKSLIKELQ